MSRLRTPAQDRGLLAEPAFDALPERLDRNRQLLDADRVRVGELPLRELRRLARQELLSGDDSPLVVTGHQPELFHPGVWVKNFAACGLARRFGGRSLNLIVDNDAVKSADLNLPTWDRREADRVRVAAVPFAQVPGEQPWETLLPPDEAAFRAVPDRVAELTTAWGYQPLLPHAWARMQGDTLGERFTAARRAYERTWGCENAELPVSRLCRTQAFQAFAGHLLGDLPRFRAVHNAAVQGYRQRHGLRSRTHPVPDLAEGEAPFWRVAGRRRDRATAATPADQLRPRVLTLTLFARLCLGDLFIHGIGGGKYDEVTDAIVRDYFGIEPPAFQILSGTLFLPLPGFGATGEDVERQARLVRDLHWNPQRHLDAPPADHARLRELRPGDHAGRRQRSRDFRRLAETLRPRVADQLTAAEARLAEMKAEAGANAILRRRDYAWVLYPEEVLRDFLQSVQRRAAGQ